ncbi:hypothetical protein Tco_0566688 [Tanacetum coccineum]
MIGRGRDTKTTEVARHTGVEGLGEDKKGVSKAHKEYYKEGDGNNRIFMFRGKSKEEASCWVGSDGSKGVVCAEHQKKGWVSMIIRVERPDVIGLQERSVTWLTNNGSKCYGNERLRFCAITDKRELRGYNFDMGYKSIHVPHNSQQKASLWDRLAGLMDKMKGEVRRGAKEKIELYKNEVMRWELEVENRTLSDNERLISLEARKMWEKKKNEFSNMLR